MEGNYAYSPFKLLSVGSYQVSGESVLHTNILSKNGTNLRTMVAGFTKIGSSKDSDLQFLTNNIIVANVR